MLRVKNCLFSSRCLSLKTIGENFSSPVWWYRRGVIPLAPLFWIYIPWWDQQLAFNIAPWRYAAMETLPQAAHPCRTRVLLSRFIWDWCQIHSPPPWLPGATGSFREPLAPSACGYTEGPPNSSRTETSSSASIQQQSLLVTHCWEERFCNLFQVSDIGNPSPRVSWLESILG